ncbi:MAG TPA: SpoIIE family protein phosphatase [Candidatus Polarisedimenticolaceae bacterium]|nr:SpoIIE family protein phosphatase [Candidatus Polarisedimenticolaceae bacterium]
MTIRALLVDDEPPARARLRAMLDRIDGLQIVGEASNGVEAVEQIGATRPDLVFLDVEMPGLSGIQVAASLAPPRPAIVFCTAYDRYAIPAFDHHATDYVLKPVQAARLERTIARVRETLAHEATLRGELEAATDTQRRLLPQRLPEMRTLDYAGSCRPAKEVGGDYYDFLALDDGGLGLALADVSGKGIFAALLSASLQAKVQALAPHYERVDQLVGQINRMTHASIAANRYATMFYGRYDDETRALDYVNAGHLPPIVVRRGARPGETRIERLAPSGTVVGLLAEARYRRRRIALRPGDLFCIFTDGLSETRDAAGEEFGCTRLERLLTAHSAESDAERVTSAIRDELDAFAGARTREDDLTWIVGCVR